MALPTSKTAGRLIQSSILSEFFAFFQMEELLKVCETQLNNADLDISIELPDSDIILNFVVGVSLRNVVFRCGNYTRLKVAKSADENELFFIGETYVELITSKAEVQKLYEEDGWRSIPNTQLCSMFRIRCDGSIMLDIVCGTLAWKMGDGEFQSVALPAIGQ